MSVLAAVSTAGAPADTGHYVHWGVISVSVTNLTIVLIMLAVFVLAIVIPFGRHGGGDR